MSSEPNRIVLGVEDIDRKYEVLEKLAEGGMGAIYKARHLLLDEIRVIKTVRPQYRDDPELKERFLREARLATHLHHPNIARIHDLSVGEDGTACIVMEFVHGVNLVDRIQHEPRLEQREILELAGQTLDALGYLHQRKIVHRDISPDNIMLARDAEGRTQVKLIDLGIAKPLEGVGFQTKTAMFIGKIRYASPEQLGGGHAAGAPGPVAIDGRSDLYSLGVVLYELLTGAFPIRGSDEASVIAGHLFHPPREFSETDPGGRVDEPLRRVLLRTLQKDPAYRFQSAAELSRALQDAARGVSAEDLAGTQAARTLIHAPTPLPHPTAQGDAREPTAGWDPTVLGPGTPVPAATSASPGRTVVAGGPEAAVRPLRDRRALLRSLAALVAVMVVLGVGYLIWALVNGAEKDDGGPVENPLAGIEFGNYKAVVIGNSRYRYQPALETAARDAGEIAYVLENRYGFEVILLQDADRETMVTALSELAEGATEEDNLLVYFAGHGEFFGPDRVGNWLPVDAQPDDASLWVSSRYDVAHYLDLSLARHVLVIADSCFSGSLTRPGAARPAGEGSDPQTLTRDQVLGELQQRSRLVLTSGEISPVVDSGGDGHSIFSGALLEVLQTNRDVLDAAAIYSRLTPRVVEASERLGVPQRPRLGAVEGDGGAEAEGTFFFVPKPDEAAPAQS
ncbi:MAG: protein kinase domain-containing protein [Thermoanaerobaculia bacterium]